MFVRRRKGSLTSMDGTMAPQRRGTAWAWRRWTESTTAMGSNGRRDGELRVMEGAAQRQGTAWLQRQLNGEGRRDGESTMLDDEEPRERVGDVDVDTAGGGSNKGQRGIEF